ncbi:MAG: pimeloyl-ACP methyl ester carboxylesterase [Arenicella sp.]|jgi:pimeloyl-ACP methyl ester carboxylesterase
MQLITTNNKNIMRHLIFSLFILFALCLSVSASANQLRHVEYPTYTAHVNGLSIAYQDFGKSTNGTILLVMGLGAQLITWNDELVLGLADAGYRVIRFDNRDVGWSEKFNDLPTPGIVTGIRYKLGLSLGAPYKLDDMAADAYGLLEHLKIERAHVVGASMGGMIAQIMAAKYPERIASLTSIMSTSGAEHLPEGSVEIDFSASGKFRDEVISGTVALVRKFGGSIGTMDQDLLRQRIARAYDRSYYPDGSARQLWAIADSGDRIELLKTVKQPTLVLHGKQDTLIPFQAGEHTAELVKDAKLVLLDGMGHSIDQANIPIIVKEIVALAATVD